MLGNLKRNITMQSAAAGRSPAGSSSPRPHLLALHGWRTSASVLAQQLQRSGLYQLLSPVAELTCLDAPHPARGPPTSDVRRAFQPPFYEWWDAVQEGGALRYVGVEDSLELLASELRAAAAAGRPVAGLLGFSQGAILAGLAVKLQERGERFQDVPPLRCAVLIAGGVVRDPAFSHLYGSSVGETAAAATTTTTTSAGAAAHVAVAAATPVAAGAAAVPLSSCCPSCHLMGSADPLRGNSEKLLGLFRQPLVLRHDQGHVVPRLDSEQRRELLEFLTSSLVHSPPPPPPPPPPQQQPLSSPGLVSALSGAAAATTAATAATANL
ncbi:hypothetical protein PLESTB_000097400 [Pleodorina starrii]|uniref:Serine hydrolase domain-containing protein n=1 Tax=Pleodorina starrii TaxID=330485 RepID=A0A9W6EXG9_9CHLO|nr:hypothetical protein PLESTM_000093900 [Pleodorina starrii]GLC48434.1 hypothetical protein PLESTB_000097400 [Pleodorina starrii]GLC71756.1 hypothetical protein PLESTF_001163200 [Pleodorina starrii]